MLIVFYFQVINASHLNNQMHYALSALGERQMKRERIFYALGIALLFTSNTLAGSGANFIFTDKPYHSQFDSPFDLDFPAYNFRLETFEDGQLNTTGLSAIGGEVRFPSTFTDSVDFDDGIVDGWGQDGHSFWAFADPENGPLVRFEFDIKELGMLPTAVGLVWTDGNPDAITTFEAFGANGNSLGIMQFQLGDDFHQGSTAEDRFIGIIFAGGISAIELSADIGRIEMDHIQYGDFIPTPGILGMLAIGGLLSRRSRKR